MPVILCVLLAVGAAFLIFSLTRSPYESAMKKAEAAMEKQDYDKAISQYTIAQKLKPNEAQPYIKAIEAIAKSNDLTMVKDILTTVNECINYCGDNSIEPSYIVYITDIMEENGAKKQAIEVLSHLYYTLAQTDEVQKRLSKLQSGDKPADAAEEDKKEDVKEQPRPTESPSGDASPADSSDDNTNSSKQEENRQSVATAAPKQTYTQGKTPAPTSTPSREQPKSSSEPESGESSAKPTTDNEKNDSEPKPTLSPNSTPAEGQDDTTEEKDGDAEKGE